MSEVNWLESLKAGDEVAMFGGYDRTPRIARVSRTTATRVFIGQTSFNRKTGRMTGSSTWDSSYIREPSQDDRDKAEVRALRYRIETAVRRHDIPLTALRIAASALTPNEAGHEEREDG